MYFINEQKLGSVPHASFERYSLLDSVSAEIDDAFVDGWDGPGSKAVSAKVCILAEKILSPFGHLPTLTEVAPGRDGSLSFIWENNRSYIYVDIGPSDTVHLYVDFDGQDLFEGVSIASDAAFMSRLDQAFSRFAGLRLRQATFALPANENTGQALYVPGPSGVLARIG